MVNISLEETKPAEYTMREDRLYLSTCYKSWMFVAIGSASLLFQMTFFALGAIFDWELYADARVIMWINILGFTAWHGVFTISGLHIMFAYSEYYEENNIVLSPLLLLENDGPPQSTAIEEDVENQEIKVHIPVPIAYRPSSGIWKNWEWDQSYTFYKVVFYLLAALEISCMLVMSLYLVIAPIYCLTVGGKHCCGCDAK